MSAWIEAARRIVHRKAFEVQLPDGTWTTDFPDDIGGEEAEMLGIERTEPEGVLLDLFTASMLVQIHDALNEANQAKYAALPLHRAVTIGWELANPGRCRVKATRWSKTGYECPACGDWHDLSETPIGEVAGFVCQSDDCEEFHEGDVLEPVEMIVTEGRDYVPVDSAATEVYPCPDDPENVFGGDPFPQTRYRYECGEVGEEEVEPDEVWECGECETKYVDRDEAKECCR